MWPRFYPGWAHHAALAWRDPWLTTSDTITQLPAVVARWRRYGWTWGKIAAFLKIPVRVAVAWAVEGEARALAAWTQHIAGLGWAWLLTLAGLLDRTGRAHHDPQWWAAWLAASLRPWHRGCRPIAPWSAEARSPRRLLCPTRVESLPDLLEELDETQDAVRKAWTPAGDGWRLDVTGPAYQELTELRREFAARAQWLNRRRLPLPEQVALLMAERRAFTFPNPPLVADDEARQVEGEVFLFTYFLDTQDLPPELWSLTPEKFRALLLAVEGIDPAGPYAEPLYQLALHLILDAPIGRPTTIAAFLARFHTVVLAEAWDTDSDAEAQASIDAVVSGKQPPLNALLAQCHHALRQWTSDPATLTAAAERAGIDLTAAPAAVTTEKEN